jgi:hypothetical protein
MPMKLIYFDVRGVMEVGRYMLAMSGTEYEDFRYPVESASKTVSFRSFRCPFRSAVPPVSLSRFVPVG